MSILKELHYKCADCGSEMNEGEVKTFTVCDDCWDKQYKKDKATNANEQINILIKKYKKRMNLADGKGQFCNSPEYEDMKEIVKDLREIQLAMDGAERES